MSSTGRSLVIVATALAWTLGGGPARAQGAKPAQPEVREVPLDLPADFAPVPCGGSVYLFSSNGRNQTMAPGEKAPACNLTHLQPLVPPVCGPGGPFVLTSDGTLWKLSAEGPQTVEQGLMGALALAASTGGSPVVLFPDRLMLAGGKSIPLPFEALRMGTLSDGSTWVGGRGMAARLDAEGKILWTWKGGLTPSGIALGGGFLAAGTEEGFLVALDATTGREKFRYPTGAAIVSAPAIAGGLAVFASRDHLVRAVRLRDGQLAWQVRLEGRPDFGPLPTRAGLVFAVYASATLIALNPADGRRTWSWRLPAGAVLQSPSATPDQVAVLAWGEAETPTLFLVPVPEPPPPPVRPKRKPRRESFEDR